MTVPPTGVRSFPVITRWGMEKLLGSRQGVGRHRTLCFDQVASLWQDREAVCVANSYPSSHLQTKDAHDDTQSTLILSWILFHSQKWKVTNILFTVSMKPVSLRFNVRIKILVAASAKP